MILKEYKSGNFQAFILIVFSIFLPLCTSAEQMQEDPTIYIEPASLDFEIDSAEFVETVVNIWNESDNDIIWETEIEYLEAEDHQNRFASIPSRDNAGDVISDLWVDFNETYGMAWDGELMWGVSRSEGLLFSVDLEGEDVIHDFDIHDSPRAMTFDGNHFWIASYNPASRVWVYSREGELVQTFDFRFRGISGLTFTDEGYLLVNSWDRQQIFVVNPEDGEVIHDFNILRYLDLPHGFGLSRLEWVEAHVDGKLWVLAGNHEIPAAYFYRLNLRDDFNIEVKDSFELEIPKHTGFAHDGKNMWHGGEPESALWWQYHDGYYEIDWISIEPDDGIIEAQVDIDLIIGINTSYLAYQDYRANIFLNTQGNENEVFDIPVHLRVYNPDDVEFDPVRSPETIEINGVYPNPFNNTTSLQFKLSKTSDVSIQIFNLNGKSIALQEKLALSAGYHQYSWNAAGLPAGVYLARFNVNEEYYLSEKILLLK